MRPSKTNSPVITAVAVIGLVFVVLASCADTTPSPSPLAESPQLISQAGTGQQATNAEQVPDDGHSLPEAPAHKLELATFGTGCFWCTEAVFERLTGVQSVVSGYSGGNVPNPSYKLVCSGATGHAEVVQVSYDPDVISYARLLEVFWQTHDPTTLNRQGNDVGTQYRSAIFYHNDDQKSLAEKYKLELDKSKAFGRPVVTEITQFDAFYPAEDEHQDFYELNQRQPYCQFVIRPKLDKLEKAFADALKPESRD